MWTVARCLSALVALLAAACATPLPDPESPGAALYRGRCSGCHRLYAPSVLTAAMWEIQVDRMHAEMKRRGVPPLDPEERDVLLRYLRAHATDAAPSPGRRE